jgi:hypothetical protein
MWSRSSTRVRSLGLEATALEVHLAWDRLEEKIFDEKIVDFN